jgi:hypothetical protein
MVWKILFVLVLAASLGLALVAMFGDDSLSTTEGEYDDE